MRSKYGIDEERLVDSQRYQRLIFQVQGSWDDQARSAKGETEYISIDTARLAVISLFYNTTGIHQMRGISSHPLRQACPTLNSYP
jgi:hypothetical protein